MIRIQSSSSIPDFGSSAKADNVTFSVNGQEYTLTPRALQNVFKLKAPRLSPQDFKKAVNQAFNLAKSLDALSKSQTNSIPSGDMPIPQTGFTVQEAQNFLKQTALTADFMKKSEEAAQSGISIGLPYELASHEATKYSPANFIKKLL